MLSGNVVVVDDDDDDGDGGDGRVNVCALVYIWLD
jgi:hypothetical protein